jgi:glycosyltransferase involved in cell wall biosynthesis
MAIKFFLRQDYANKELIIIDDGSDPVADLIPVDRRVKYIYRKEKSSLGAKRNAAIEQSNSEIILHWDDDDWHARHRIQYQVRQLLEHKADICGIHKVIYFDLRSKRPYLYEYPLRKRMWLAGGSLCYRKSFWAKNKFEDINVGEDTRFVWKHPLSNALLLSDFKFYVAMVHPRNTSKKSLQPPYWKKWAEEEIRKLMADDWEYYGS